MDFLGKNIPGRGVSQCKGPEAKTVLEVLAKQLGVQPGWSSRSEGESGGGEGREW